MATFAVSYPLFQSSSRILEDAYYSFETGNYGDALRLADEAKIMRRQEVSDSLGILEQALRPIAVQNMGDSIEDVISVLKEREVFDAVTLMEYLLSTKGDVFFDNSVAKMKSYIEEKYVFPETEYLFARIYEFEGEYELAYSYYLNAWEHSDVLDIPDMKYDVLYDMANLACNFSHVDECEKALLLIVADDPYFSDRPFLSALNLSVDRGYSADKIFDLYRTNCYRSIPAFFRLTELYMEQGRDEEAFNASLFGVLTAFTRMYEILCNRTTEYEYTTLLDFFHQAMSHDDIAEWSMDNGFWRCLYRLADLGSTLYPENHLFSSALFAVMAETAPESYWKQITISKLTY